MAMMIAMTEYSGRQLGLSCQSCSVHNICFLVTLEKFDCALVSDLRTIWIQCPSVFEGQKRAKSVPKAKRKNASGLRCVARVAA